MLRVVGDGDPVSRPDRTQPVYRWRFKCDCGNTVDARPQDVMRSITKGKTVSCGCYRISLNSDRAITHGRSQTRTWNAWKSMKARCTASNRPQWKDYGGRGITFDPRWEAFEAFLADMGECPEGLTLDRIDNNGNYEPGNCRWTNYHTQFRNRRNNVWVTLRGESMIFSDACRALGRKPASVSAMMIKRGLTHQAMIDLYAAHQ